MRLLTFVHKNEEAWGAMTDRGVAKLGSTNTGRFPDLRAVLDAGALNEARAEIGKARQFIDPAEISYRPVVPNPRKILCVGLNYETHRIETGRSTTGSPTIFTRFADTQCGHLANLLVPRVSKELDYEGELAVIIGKAGRHIEPDEAMSHVAGYSCYNDASVRDYQRHTSQFTPGKNFPDTAGFGPWLVTQDEIENVHDLAIRTVLNGEVMQDASTAMMIFDIPALICYLSSFTELRPGDVIATGTPGGVGFKRDPQVFLQPGDEIVVEIESVGRLINGVASET